MAISGKSKTTYLYVLVNKQTGERIMRSRSLKAITDHLHISICYPSGTRFYVERKSFCNGHLFETFLNYKQYEIA